MQYRKEIDGLRAIAVLPVLFFHAGITVFSGGFLGVDVFFVISGYLITSIILDEVKQNTFSITNFYERRARRILPALSIVLFCTSIAALQLMPQPLFLEYLESLAYVSTFLSNVFFYFQSDYFASPTDEMPLLHTWSLAVEEQYYLFFPLLVVLMISFARTYLFPVIFLTAVASFLYSQYLTDMDLKEANFYFIFSRAWELLLGSIIAFFPPEKIRSKGLKREFWSLLGFAMICYSIVSYDERTPHPSFYTLLPVIGTCFVLLFTNASTLVGRILSIKPMVFIGLISYSLYLWHQPLFALIRIRTLGEPSTSVFMIAIISSVVLATFSWRYIETPFRNKQKFTRASIFKFTTASIAIFFIIGFSGNFYNNSTLPIEVELNNPQIARDNTKPINENSPVISETSNEIVDIIESSSEQVITEIKPDADTQIAEQEREISSEVPQIIQSARAQDYPRENNQTDYNTDCHAREGYTLRPSQACRYFDGNNINWAILGDSHADSLGYALAEKLKPRKEGLLHLSFDGCPPALLFEAYENGCTYWTKQAVSYLENSDEIENVIVTYRHSGYLFGYHLDAYPNLTNNSASEVMNGRLYYEMDEGRLKDLYWRSFQTIITKLLDAGKTVFITFPIPELPAHIYKDFLFDIRLGTTSEYYFARHNYILQKLSTLPFGDNLKIINPYTSICTEANCPAVKNGRLLYMDDNHLNIYGASLVLDEIFAN